MSKKIITEEIENHPVVSHEQWVKARQAFLAKEKKFTKLRDELSRERRELPWEKVGKDYVFDGPKGKETLADLFGDCSQLVVYHFMFDPRWTTGCASCSFWADNFNNIPPHLRQRDVTMLAISRAPLKKLEAFKKRLGWSFKWVSSYGSDFNYDFHVSFTPAQIKQGRGFYNYREQEIPCAELPGISVFYKDGGGAIYHTYSCFARGLDMMNGAYHYLDLTPKGRDEDGLPRGQAWVDYHDKYK